MTRSRVSETQTWRSRCGASVLLSSPGWPQRPFAGRFSQVGESCGVAREEWGRPVVRDAARRDRFHCCASACVLHKETGIRVPYPEHLCIVLGFTLWHTTWVDYGAQVLRVDKPVPFTVDTLTRGKRSIAVDLKRPEGVSIVKKLCQTVRN